MPPLWEYYSLLLEADESIAAPKGRESRTPSLFPCKRTASRGPRKGATMPIADPSARHPSTASPVLVVGEGHAPVVAVLRDEAKKKPDVSIPAPKGRESRTPTDFPLHNSVF
jgi:hypothetical protein